MATKNRYSPYDTFRHYAAYRSFEWIYYANDGIPYTISGVTVTPCTGRSVIGCYQIKSVTWTSERACTYIYIHYTLALYDSRRKTRRERTNGVYVFRFVVRTVNLIATRAVDDELLRSTENTIILDMWVRYYARSFETFLCGVLKKKKRRAYYTQTRTTKQKNSSCPNYRLRIV